jgi:outer membrane protein assembly factor BamB
VRPGKDAEVVYRVDRQANYVPSPLAHGDLVYLWSDNGIVSCIDAKSGKPHWQERVGGTYSGSPIRVRDRLYCMSDEGEVVVLSAGTMFQEIARNALGEESRATPAVSGGRMYLRTFSHLMSLGGRSGDQESGVRGSKAE